MYQNKITSQQTVTIAKDAAITSTAIDYRDASSGSFILPAAMEATSKIAFKVCATSDGTFVPMYNASNALVELTVVLNASKCYPLPSELASVAFFKIWTEASATDVAQATAARDIIVMLKS